MNKNFPEDSGSGKDSGEQKRRLTLRQQEVLDFIKVAISREGYPPTVRDIAGCLNIISLNAVRRHLQALQKKNYIELEAGKSRGIRLVNDRKFIDEGTPIVGRIAAGPLSSAIQDVEGYVSLDPSFWGDTDEMFLLRVKGDSMFPKLEDGDLVGVRRQPSAVPGSFVVAVVEDEATVKQLVIRDEKYFLHPLNPAYNDIPVDERCVINGVVIGLIRKI